MFARYLKAKPRTAFACAAALTVAIALLDWRIELNVSFGFLYMFPMLLAGPFLARWQIAAAALLCTVLADVFDPFQFNWAVELPLKPPLSAPTISVLV